MGGVWLGVEWRLYSPDSADRDQGVVHADQVAMSPWDRRRFLWCQNAIGLGIGTAINANEDRVQVDPGAVKALRNGCEIPACRINLKCQTSLPWTSLAWGSDNMKCKPSASLTSCS